MSQMEMGKKINQNFSISWPIGDGQLAEYLALEQKDSVQQSEGIIMNNRSFTTDRIKVAAGTKE